VPSTTYSTVDDLLIGDIPLGSRVDANKFVQDAADEMNSVLGFRYQVPITTCDGSPHIALLLKRINNHLATGRLILAVAAGSEDSLVHAYGLKLIEEAIQWLNQIVQGQIFLECAIPVDTTSGLDDSGPTIFNQDANSAIEAFYEYAMTPWSGTVIGPIWEPGPEDD